MAHREWQVIKVRYCDHAGAEVKMEAELIYPSDLLPDRQPRVVAHRCSHAVFCNLDGRASCVWSGTNPIYDPFSENA